MQGYGKPHYTNVQMPWPNLPPDVPEENPTGIYRRTFTVPADRAGRRTVLHFGGCQGVLYLYVNGQPVGLSKDAFTPAEFDITQYAQVGQENELRVVVVQYSDASFIEDQDQWWQAGLMREGLISTAQARSICRMFLPVATWMLPIRLALCVSPAKSVWLGMIMATALLPLNCSRPTVRRSLPSP